MSDDNNGPAVPADEPKAEQPKAEQPKAERRVRRSRAVKKEEPPAAPDDAPKSESPKPERAPRRKRKPRTKPAAGPTTGDGPRPKIHRQDVQSTSPQPPPVKRAKPAPEKKASNELDKITLMLHPAPKAAPQRHKKKEGRPLTAKEAMRAKAEKKRGKSKDKAPKQQTAKVALKPKWLKANADSAAEMLEAAGDAAEALVQAWLKDSNASAIARAALLDGIAGKARKAARRALNVLKSRGVEIPKLEAEAPTAQAEPEPHQASFVPPDANGMTFISISQRQKGGRYHVADVVFRQPLGVVHASSGRIAGKAIRNWKQRVTERFGTAPIDVPLEWARHMIAEARKLNDTSKHVVPLGFDNCLALCEPAPDKEPPHPVADLEAALGKADVEKASGDSDTLHNDPEFAAWMPDKPSIDELLAKLGESLGTEGSSDSERVDEALKTEVASATDRYFTPEVRETIANRMRDSAISVRHRAGDAAARRVLAVARAVREAGLITSPPSEISFLQGFFRKAVSVLVRQGQGKLQIPIPQSQPQD